MCRPKKEGGLGITDIFLTNTILNLKHIGNLLDPSNKSLWKLWVHMYRLKNKSFWKVKMPAHCSWYWGKLLKLRPVAKPLIIHKIGTGDHTFLWYDNWLPIGPLLDRYPERIAYDAAININAKVRAIVRGLDWNWPVSRSCELDEVRSILSSFPPPSGSIDTMRWNITPNGAFHFATVWNHVRVHHPIVPWHKVVWYHGGTPRQSFILWLAANHRLATHDRISKFTMGPLACVFCQSHMEAHDHLFFACTYSVFIWQDLMRRCGLTWNKHNWNNTLLWMAQNLKGKKAHHIIPKICLGVAVYGLWRERNQRTFKLVFSPKEVILKYLVSQVHDLINVKWKNHSTLRTIIGNCL